MHNHIINNPDLSYTDTMVLTENILFNESQGTEKDTEFILSLHRREDLINFTKTLLDLDYGNEAYLAAFEKSQGKRDLSVLYVPPVFVMEEESSTK